MLAALAGLLLALLLFYPTQAMEAAWEGLTIWAQAVLPALLPYLMATQLLAGSTLLSRLCRFASPATRRLLGCPGEGAPAVLLGLLGGSPAGARLLSQLHAQGTLTTPQAERLAVISGTVSPMFLLGVLPQLSGLPGVGTVLLASHWLGALVLGLLWPRSPEEQRPAARRPTAAPVKLGEAALQATQAMLVVGACIVLFTVAARLLGMALPFLPAQAAAALHALLEMAGGTQALCKLSLPPQLLTSALCAAVSMGGLSIFAQNYAFLAPAGVRAPRLLAARGLHGLLSGGLAYLLFPTLCGDTAAFSPAPLLAMGEQRFILAGCGLLMLYALLANLKKQPS